MIAITHGIGPASRPSGSSRRSAVGSAARQRRRSRCQPAAARRIAQRAGRDRTAARVPAASSRRSRRATSRWMSCVATTIVVPSLLSASNRWSSRAAISGSTLPVGSSATRISGRPITARAIATRCCSPPDSVAGRGLGAVGEADPVEHLAHRRVEIALLHPGDAQRQRDIVEGGEIAGPAGNPGTPRRSGGGSRACRSRGSVTTSSSNSRISPRLGRCAR